MAYYEDDICDAAVEAYYTWHKAHGTPEAAIIQPSRYETTRDDTFVYIRKGTGELAWYSIAEQRIVDPAEIESGNEQ